ncbi:MAG: hypothetical protein GYB64_15905 [Chloroflexi bacterium]|nr:hypothetical protein [Chloroflexota bacterium]
MTRKRAGKKHRLIVYYRLGKRLRTTPILIILMVTLLLALGWLAQSGLVEAEGLDLLMTMWSQRLLLGIIIAACLLIVFVTILISRTSYVQAREKTLRVKAGLYRMDVAYKRIRQIRLVQVGAQYPLEKLRGRDRALISPLEGFSATAVDMKSWPIKPTLLRRLWSRFMFTTEGDALMLVVEDALDLNRDIEARMGDLFNQKGDRGYKDPIDRAFEQMKRSRSSGSY